MKRTTICVLTYGDFYHIAKRCIDSIIQNCPRELYELRIGCNSVSVDTLTYVASLVSQGLVDCAYISNDNLHKAKMMRRMYKDISTEFIWWFDDDSFVTEPDALQRWVEHADSQGVGTVVHGKVYFFNGTPAFAYNTDVIQWIKEQPWYRGKPVPCGITAYDPQFNTIVPDERFFFVTGGVHMVRTDFINLIDWPNLAVTKRNDDVILCCAVLQNEYKFSDIGYGVEINKHERRGASEM